MASGTCAIVSFRLGMTDGVSVVAARWADILSDLGFAVATVAGAGPVDVLLPGLAADAAEPPRHGEIDEALAGADLVLVENLLSIPLNLDASRVVMAALRGRPALLHHHDPPWQRAHFAHVTELPPTDPSWRHVTINAITERQLAVRGVEAVTIYNPFDTDSEPGDRTGTRERLGIDADTLLVAHPVRAIPRKNIPVALRIAEQLGAAYWLPGPAEDGYDRELAWLLEGAGCPVLRDHTTTVPDIYAASDLVVFPSTWEGFGNPPVEAAIYRRPVVVGDYAVAHELQALGFEWFAPYQLAEVRAFLAAPDPALLDNNQQVAAAHFSIPVVTRQIAALLDAAGWLP